VSSKRDVEEQFKRLKIGERARVPERALRGFKPEAEKYTEIMDYIREKYTEIMDYIRNLSRVQSELIGMGIAMEGTGLERERQLIIHAQHEIQEAIRSLERLKGIRR